MALDCTVYIAGTLFAVKKTLPHPSFGSLVAQTGRQWRRTVDRLLQPFGLTQATWLPLLHLSRADAPLRQKDLADLLAVDNSALVRILDRLQKEGLVERREGSDRRAKELHVTQAGRDTAARVEAVGAEVRRHALSGIKEADVATTERVLRHVIDTLANYELELSGD